MRGSESRARGSGPFDWWAIAPEPEALLRGWGPCMDYHPWLGILPLTQIVTHLRARARCGCAEELSTHGFAPLSRDGRSNGVNSQVIWISSPELLHLSSTYTPFSSTYTRTPLAYFTLWHALQLEPSTCSW